MFIPFSHNVFFLNLHLEERPESRESIKSLLPKLQWQHKNENHTPSLHNIGRCLVRKAKGSIEVRCCHSLVIYHTDTALGQNILLTAGRSILWFPSCMLSEQKRRATGGFWFIFPLFQFSYWRGDSCTFLWEYDCACIIFSCGQEICTSFAFPTTQNTVCIFQIFI